MKPKFETEKGDVGPDEYETRSWAGLASPHSHVPAGWSVPAGPAAGLGGKRCPGSPVPRACPRVDGGVPGGAGDAPPGSSSGPINCCCGWRIRSYATNGLAAPTRDAAPPAVKAGWSHHLKRVVVVLALSALNHDQFSAGSPASGPHRCKPTGEGLPIHLKVLRFGIWSKRNTCGSLESFRIAANNVIRGGEHG